MERRTLKKKILRRGWKTKVRIVNNQFGIRAREDKEELEDDDAPE